MFHQTQKMFTENVNWSTNIWPKNIIDSSLHLKMGNGLWFMRFNPILSSRNFVGTSENARSSTSSIPHNYARVKKSLYHNSVKVINVDFSSISSLHKVSNSGCVCLHEYGQILSLLSMGKITKFALTSTPNVNLTSCNFALWV